LKRLCAFGATEAKRGGDCAATSPALASAKEREQCSVAFASGDEAARPLTFTPLMATRSARFVRRTSWLESISVHKIRGAHEGDDADRGLTNV
jgi:hypothetical protein